MKTSASMPISTRFWAVALLAATLFLGWALFWPAVDLKSNETTHAALPVYTLHDAMPAAAPNAADPALARPLYFNDRRPRIAVVAQGVGVGAADQGFDVVLTGIVRSAGLQLATLSPAGGKPVRVKLGEEVEGKTGWRLVSLGPRTATFRSGEREQVLRMDARDAATAPAPLVPPASLSGGAPDMPRPPDQAAPPAVPGVTGQASGTPPVTSSSPVANAPANTAQDQQIQAIRRRIEDARRQARPPNSPEPSR